MSYLEMMPKWIPNSPTGYIIAGFIAVLLIYLAYWIAYASVKISLWITSESLRITFYSLYLTHYSLFVVFVSAPIGLLFQRRSLGEIVDRYGANVKMAFFIFYPKVEEKIKKENQKISEAAPKHIHHYHHHQIDPRSEEIAAETEIIFKKKPTQQSGKFFCTNCGDGFTPAMFVTFEQKGYAFCEGCGKRFELDPQSIPTPTK